MTSPPDALVVVFDVGTTHVKLTAFAADGTAADAVVSQNGPVPGPPYPHWDARRLRAFLLYGLARLSRLGTVTDIVPITHGASCAMICDDALALPLMNYEWDGIGAVDEAYDALRAPFEETGSPRLPGGQNAGRQIYYAQTHHGDDFARCRTILTYPQYWGFVLTGKIAADASSLGAHSDLWAPFEGRHSSLVRRMGWAERMAPVRRAADVLGPLRAEVRERTGLGEDCRVRVGIHDSNASLLPYLATREAPFTLVSSGTWAIVFAVGGTADALQEARDCLVHVDAHGDPVPGARVMAGREFQRITGEVTATARIADALDVIASGAMILPSYTSGVGPFGSRAGEGADDPRLEAPARRHAAASLYVAMVLAQSVSLAGARGPLLVDGPLAGNEIALSALGVLTGQPVEALTGAGSSLAATVLAGREVTVRADPVAPPRDFADALLDHHRAWRAALG